MPREPIPTWFYAFVAVRKDNRFLFIHERSHGQNWYFPGGRAEPGEALTEAARRETVEEAGIPVILEGIIRIEHQPSREKGARLKVFFAARPQDDTPPKNTADDESLGAAWFSPEELENLPLRGEEAREICQYLASGGTIYPLDLITAKITPWQRIL